MTIKTMPSAPQHEHSPVCKDCGEILDRDLVVDGKPTAAGWRRIGRALAAPMPTRSFNGRGGKTMAYVTSRDVQRRLDAVVGPGNWSTHVRVVRAEHPVSVLVTISIFGVHKTDAGYSNAPGADDPEDRAYEDEPLKAAVSDGVKRAAVQWGCGRYLYDS